MVNDVIISTDPPRALRSLFSHTKHIDDGDGRRSGKTLVANRKSIIFARAGSHDDFRARRDGAGTRKRKRVQNAKFSRNKKKNRIFLKRTVQFFVDYKNSRPLAGGHSAKKN